MRATITVFFVLTLLLLYTSPSTATRPEPNGKRSTKPVKPTHTNKKGGHEDQDSGIGNAGDFFGPGFGVPGFRNGWENGIFGGGYGAGFEGPKGGYSKHGVIRPTVVCKERGPCYKKKLTCPATCFDSYSRSGKGYSGGGGGGGCTMDCKRKCIAYC